jgi:membrane associated rhomboid family serine protease
MNKNYDFQKDFQRHRATYLLGAVTLLVWLSQILTNGIMATSDMALFRFGAFFGPDIIDHPTHLWRLVTPIFVHIGWEHFLLNFFTLIFICRQIEEIFGGARFAAIYLLSGIFGNVLILFLQPYSLSAGASTSLFGIFGAMAMLGYLTNNPSFQVIGKQFAVILLVTLVVNLFQPSVSIVGHIGGALGGLLLAAPFAPKILQPKLSELQRITFLLVYIGLIIMMTFIALT